MSEQTPETKKALPTRGLESSPVVWNAQKTEMDVKLWGNQERLWIVENRVYDLRKYATSHPGGSHWIDLTKGQNITQHFIVHHLNEDKARQVLQKYYVKDLTDAPSQRYTFESDGLYRQVKQKILASYTPQKLQDTTKSTINGLTFFSLWFLSFLLTLVTLSPWLAVLTGLLIYPCTGIAHNFIHMRPHPFRFLWLLSGFTHQQWQLMHCISHHVYTNTLIDFEIQGFEPLIYYLKVSPKNTILSWILKQIVLVIGTPFNMLLKLIVPPLKDRRQPQWFYLVPLAQLPIIYFIGGCSTFGQALKLFLIIHMTFSFTFLKLTFLGHRVGGEWTQGNVQIRDFGEHQVHASSDTDTDNVCGFMSYLLYAGFNYHAIHHMFPTIDNHHLPQANAILAQQARKRGIKMNISPNVPTALLNIEKNFFNRKQWQGDK